MIIISHYKTVIIIPLRIETFISRTIEFLNSERIRAREARREMRAGQRARNPLDTKQFSSGDVIVTWSWSWPWGEVETAFSGLLISRSQTKEFSALCMCSCRNLASFVLSLLYTSLPFRRKNRRLHFTANFCENSVVTKKESYQNIRDLIGNDVAYTSSVYLTRVVLLFTKSKMNLSFRE